MRRDPVQREIRFNMAPMIDVVFLLIIFFMLVSTFASAENIRMDLPLPEHSLAKNVKITDRVVINCQITSLKPTGEPAGVRYSVGPNPPEPLDRISRRVAMAKTENPKLKIIIRADKRLPYEWVRDVMKIAADNQVENVSLVAHVAPGE